MASNNKKSQVQVVWFKRDLRVVDHRPLALAAENGPVLPLVVVERELWRQEDVSARQYSFFRECVLELTQELSGLGQPLIVRVGDIVDVLRKIHQEMEIASLWSHEETGNNWTFRRDTKVADWCRQNGIHWIELRQYGVIRALTHRDGWAKKWDKFMAQPIMPAPSALARLPFDVATVVPPSPDALGLHKDAPLLRQFGGRTRALTTLSSFLDQRGESYRRDMSSPVSGESACSRLSPYLAFGVISMREVAQATRRRQQELKLQMKREATGKWRGSLASFTGRLHWHCHFIQKLEDEPRLEFQNLHRAYDALRTPEETDEARLTAWQNGETGLPFVDACMRYLIATGWLNFRMRAMLLATASYHLWLHWRRPGLHLGRQFTDYEPGIHWPQVQMQSGTTGINTIRIYNPIKQGYDQDPDGDFVRRWVPELASIDGNIVHEPWRSPKAAVLLDKTYPMPIVDHMQAAREARQKIYGARKGDEFRSIANAIQTKHGSRKSGVQMTQQGKTKRKNRKSNTCKPDQLSMRLETPSHLES